MLRVIPVVQVMVGQTIHVHFSVLLSSRGDAHNILYWDVESILEGLVPEQIHSHISTYPSCFTAIVIYPSYLLGSVSRPAHRYGHE
jgi:hypothetical protein